MAQLPDGAASVWAVATRISVLDAAGFVDPGANTFTTAQALKATFTPVITTGDDVEQKNAAGDLIVFAKHGDIIKYYTVNLELGTPDPALEQACAGGTLLSSSAAALGTPTGPTLTAYTTLGSLATGTYGYRVSVFNTFGETLAASDVNTAVTGPTGGVLVEGVSEPAGAAGVRVYGRTIGIEQLIGAYPLFGSQSTNVTSGTGAVATLKTTALTKSIPVGATFTITGDTNTPKIIWTMLATAPEGTTVLSVKPSQSVTTTIAGGAIKPVYFDTGAITPSGNLPAADTTAGPGEATGYAAPALGSVANPNGVSIEMWSRAIVGGVQPATLPYYYWVIPRVTGMHQMPKDITNANTQTVLEGQAFQNSSWGSGPTGVWPFSSERVIQRARCGGQIIPAIGLTPVGAQF